MQGQDQEERRGRCEGVPPEDVRAPTVIVCSRRRRKRVKVGEER